MTNLRKLAAASMAYSLILSGCATTSPNNFTSVTVPTATVTPTTSAKVIKHVVVIFGENVSFDHYFGTYPNAANIPGEPAFTAASGTPTPNNYTSNPSLLTQNPNLATNGAVNTTNGTGATNPFRLDRAQASTASQSHSYTPEQTAFDNGKMDLFPASVGAADSATVASATAAPAIASTKGLTMGYFDGNTVTGWWNYAQHYALNDHFFGSNFGPSTPGAINLISGQTNGVTPNSFGLGTSQVADGQGGFTLTSDADPYLDQCSSTSKQAEMSGKNVGDLLNAAGVTWGWFQGGFNLSVSNDNGSTGCSRSTVSTVVGTVADYVQHHQPFQYYASTRNPSHARPTSIAAIGTTDAANHQYDTRDFTAALAAGNLPAVSFLKAPAYQDGHPGNSDPLDEQNFIINTVNSIEQSSFWSSTAIILSFDDSDGWYDHVSNMINGSNTSQDVLTFCTGTASTTALPGPNSNGKPVGGRCGYGPRLPLIVISPWANKNYLDSTVVDQSSILKFIEDTFLNSQRIGSGSYDAIAGSMNNMFNFSNGAVTPNPNVVVLNPSTGLVTSGN